MSYMRGPFYVWSSDTIHFFVNGSDKTAVLDPDDYDFEACIAVDMDLFDELVAMRHAELVAAKRWRRAQRRALAKWSGNGGCMALNRAFRRHALGPKYENYVRASDDSRTP